MGSRRTAVLVAGWTGGLVAAALHWPHDVDRVLMSAVAAGVVAMAAIELLALWRPRR
jgi:hypothetical protein